MAIASNFPAIKPSLSLDFANTKRLDSRVTFTRTTTATYYDGVTTAMAEQNLVLYSQEFDNVTGWNPIRTSISANTTTAPDGTSTADSLIEDSSASTNHYVQINTAAAGNFNGVVVNGSSITFSIFAKANTRTQVCLGFYDGSSSHTAFFDLSGGTVLSSSGVTASIVNVGSGWYRCVGVRTNTTTTMALSIQLSVAGSTTYTGNGTSGIYIWGAQLEQRSSVTAYTATTTQAITNYIPVLLTAASGVARFDHNPTTDESLGLLIEEARTNLLTYSADFSNAAWTKTDSTVTANTIVAPDGALTGDKLAASGGSVDHLIGQLSPLLSNAAPYTFSLFAKAAECTEVRLRYAGTGAFSGAPQSVVFTLTGSGSGVVLQGSPTFSISHVGNGWYRCLMTATTVAASTLTARISPAVAGNSIFNADGSGIFIWGAQLEAGAFATSYIATTAATVTRNADAASMTGTNFTSWYNAGQGTLYVDINPMALAAPNGVVINDNTTSNRIRLATTSVSDQGTVTVSGTAQATLDGGTPAANTNMKLAMTYQANNFALSLNGATAVTDTSGTVPVVSQLQIGSETTTVGNLQIKKIAYYPIASTATQLQALTS